MRLLFALLLISSSPAYAAKIIASDWYGKRVHLTLVGPIKDGDQETFKQEVLKQIRRGRLVSALQLYTPGGNVDAAISIGEQVRLLRIQTATPDRDSNDGTWDPRTDKARVCRYGPLDREEYRRDDSCDCQSACFIIWAGGVDRRGNYIGIHHPYFDSDTFAKLSATQARDMYQKMEGPVRQYFNKMDVPEHILKIMWNTLSVDMYFLSPTEIQQLRNPEAWRDQYMHDRCGKWPTEGTIYSNPQRKRVADCQGEVFESIYAEAAAKYLELYGRPGESVPETSIKPSMPTESAKPTPKIVVRTAPPTAPAPSLPAAPPAKPVVVPPTPTGRVVYTDGPNADYHVRNNRDLEGDDLQPFLRQVDQNACARACTKNAPTCQGYSFDEWNHLCILKTNVRQGRLEPRSIAGVRQSVFPAFPNVSREPAHMRRHRNKYFPGEGYLSVESGNTDACETTCFGDRNCVAYSYFKTPGTCRLFKSTGQYFSSDQADSGVKTQTP